MPSSKHTCREAGRHKARRWWSRLTAKEMPSFVVAVSLALAVTAELAALACLLVEAVYGWLPRLSSPTCLSP